MTLPRERLVELRDVMLNTRDEREIAQALDELIRRREAMAEMRDDALSIYANASGHNLGMMQVRARRIVDLIDDWRPLPPPPESGG